MQEPEACCEKSGVQVPPSLRRERTGSAASSPVSDQDPLVTIGATSSYISLSPYDQSENTVSFVFLLILYYKYRSLKKKNHSGCRS